MEKQRYKPIFNEMKEPVKEGINVSLDGYLPKENIWFRKYGLDFKKSDQGNDA